MALGSLLSSRDHDWRCDMMLALLSDARTAELKTVLYESEWLVQPVPTLAEARRHLATQNTALVLCEPHFADGDWRDVLGVFTSMDRAPNLIILTGHDGALGAELLNLGGYDLLELPLDRAECVHVIASAVRNWYGRNNMVNQSAAFLCAA